jgi:polysaccharide pyruvyl transferase WcaK-like protein
MRILLDMCIYDMRNKGNDALLQIAVRRIREYWPGANLSVISISPYILKLYCPTAHPIDLDGNDWAATGTRKDRILRSFPNPLLRLMFEIREAIWYHSPSMLSSFRIIGNRQTGATSGHEADVPINLDGSIAGGADEKETYRRLLKNIDLYVATGAQYMSDACKPDALQLLDRFEEAHGKGIPTAMVGQGIGPIHDEELRTRATQVLPLIDLIFVRETLIAPALLESVGVSPERIIFTGDDAIELAYELRTKTFGKSIGVSVRIADYTEVEDRHLESLQIALEAAHQRYNASLTAIPISHSTHERDDSFLRQLNVREGIINLRRFETPADIVKRISRCRLVVTGTYHGAVFALAQGIPVIGLARSEMYLDKFRGLAEQFGEGCQIVLLEDGHFQERIAEIFERLWVSAESLRPQLLSASARQIQLGKSAYQRIYELVCSRTSIEL